MECAECKKYDSLMCKKYNVATEREHDAEYCPFAEKDKNKDKDDIYFKPFRSKLT